MATEKQIAEVKAQVAKFEASMDAHDHEWKQAQARGVSAEEFERQMLRQTKQEKLRKRFLGVLEIFLMGLQNSPVKKTRKSVEKFVVCHSLHVQPAETTEYFAWDGVPYCMDAAEDGWVGEPFWKLVEQVDKWSAPRKHVQKRHDSALDLMNERFLKEDWDAITRLVWFFKVETTVYLCVTTRISDERTEVQWHMRVPDHPAEMHSYMKTKPQCVPMDE